MASESLPWSPLFISTGKRDGFLIFFTFALGVCPQQSASELLQHRSTMNSLLRSPSGCGTRTRLGGSKPNLSESTLDSELNQVTIRNKRKQPEDDDTTIKKELSELRKQMAEMMALLTSTSYAQTENIDQICQTVTTIKNYVKNIVNTMDHIILEQEILKANLDNLKKGAEISDKKIKSLESDIVALKSTSTSNQITLKNEELISEIQERNARAKNIVIVGIPQSKSSISIERYEHDKKEILKLTSTMYAECPEPEKIFRLGKPKTDGTRPLKVCHKSEEIAKTLLRNRSTKFENIKIFSDQTVGQRKYLQNLKIELQTRTTNGETDLHVKYVKGTPKIVKSLEKKALPPVTDTLNIPTQSKFL